MEGLTGVGGVFGVVEVGRRCWSEERRNGVCKVWQGEGVGLRKYGQGMSSREVVITSGAES